MYLDGVEIYGAPLSSSAAEKLREAPIYSWEASTGTDDAAKTEAKALQVHLRAGALPVNVELVGSGHACQPLLFETLLASSKTQPINPKARRYTSPFIKVQISI